MKIKIKHVAIVVIKIICSVIAIPGAFLLMFIFDIHMNSKFISASDGSTGPGFRAYLLILALLLIIIWCTYPLIRLIKKLIIKSNRDV